MSASTNSSPRQLNVVILGSTGSIGSQTLDVIRALPDRLRVVGLAAGANVELFAQQIREWQPEIAALSDENAARQLNEYSFPHTKIVGDLEEVATWPNADIVLSAIGGAAGLRPTIAAIKARKTIAIANKETLVAAGEIVTKLAREYGVELRPVDSEHSALAQCLLGETSDSVEKLTITASGGPFVDTTRAELHRVLAAQALKHPTWSMGRKITIDSATLMNKGLEAIEARWLFDVPMENIEIVVHRQSVIHSLVHFNDGSVKAQMGVPDMKLPIQWALLGGKRPRGAAPHLDLLSSTRLTFEAPDRERFPCLDLAWRALEMGGVAPCMMNAANEIAVQMFLDGATGFYGVSDCIAHVLERCPQTARPTLDDIYEADAEARQMAHSYLATN